MTQGQFNQAPGPASKIAQPVHPSLALASVLLPVLHFSLMREVLPRKAVLREPLNNIFICAPPEGKDTT